MQLEIKGAAFPSSHQSLTCLPLSEQNDQVYIHGSLADSKQEETGRCFIPVHTHSMQYVSDMLDSHKTTQQKIWQQDREK